MKNNKRILIVYGDAGGRIDCHFVATHAGKTRLEKLGVSKQAIYTGYFPNFMTLESLNFSEAKVKAPQSKKPMVLFTGGGHGMATMLTFVHELSKSRLEIRIILQAGKNPDLVQKLQQEFSHDPRKMWNQVSPNL